MNLQFLYEHAYRHLTPDQDILSVRGEEDLKGVAQFWNQLRETSFYHQIKTIKDKDVLVTGSGLGHIPAYFARQGARVMAVECSSLATSFAKNLYAQEFSAEQIKWIQGDVTEDWKKWAINIKESKNQLFDLIFDNHLIHCLPYRHQRRSYLKNIEQFLKPSGLLMMETMAWHKEISLNFDWSLDEENVLWQYLVVNDERAQFYPVRSLYRPEQIEEELKNSSLNLEYFLVHHELRMPLVQQVSKAKQSDFKEPQVVRLVAKKQS